MNEINLKVKNGEIKCLTGIRGVAAIYVAIYHLLHNSLDYTFIKNGYLGVDLFFILSGFIMTYTYNDKFRELPSIKDVYVFINHRFSRIWPTYIFWTLVTILLFTKIPNLQYSSIIPNFLMIQNWGTAAPLLGTSWSVSVEMAIYFIFPVMCILATNGTRTSLVSAFIISILAIFALSFFRTPFIDGTQVKFSGPLDLVAFNGVGPILRGAFEFMLGVIGWKIFSFASTYKNKNAIDALSIIISASILLLLTFKGLDVFIVLMISLLIPLIGAKPTKISNLLGSKPLHFLGLISYSLYLCHALFIYDLHKFFYTKLMYSTESVTAASIISILLSVASIIGISYMSFIIIEKPLRTILRTKIKFSKK